MTTGHKELDQCHPNRDYSCDPLRSWPGVYFFDSGKRDSFLYSARVEVYRWFTTYRGNAGWCIWEKEGDFCSPEHPACTGTTSLGGGGEGNGIPGPENNYGKAWETFVYLTMDRPSGCHYGSNANDPCADCQKENSNVQVTADGYVATLGGGFASGGTFGFNWSTGLTGSFTTTRCTRPDYTCEDVECWSCGGQAIGGIGIIGQYNPVDQTISWTGSIGIAMGTPGDEDCQDGSGCDFGSCMDPPCVVTDVSSQIGVQLFCQGHSTWGSHGGFENWGAGLYFTFFLEKAVEMFDEPDLMPWALYAGQFPVNYAECDGN